MDKQRAIKKDNNKDLKHRMSNNEPCVKEKESKDGNEIEETIPDPQQTTVIPESRKEPKKSPFIAFSLALFSGFAFSVFCMLSKQTRGIDIVELSLYFSLGNICFTLPIAIYRKENFLFSKATWFYLTIRGFALSGITVLPILTFRFLPLGDASVIMFSTPVFVTIFARIIFKERCGRLELASLLLTLLGLILTTKLPKEIYNPTNRFSSDYLIGLLAAFGALACNSTVVLIIRKLRSIHYSVLVLVNNSFSCLTFVVIKIFTSRFSIPCDERFAPIGMGVMGFLGQVSMVLSVQLFYAGPVSTTKGASDIAFAFLWQVVYFGDVPDAFVVSGAVIVASSIAIIGFKNYLLTLPKDSRARKLTLFLTK